MRIPSTLPHDHHVLSRKYPAVPFLLSRPTSVQRQTLSPRLLQFRPSSSSGSDDVVFQNRIHQLIAAQKAVDRAQTKGGVTMRDMIKRSRTMTSEEQRVMRDQYVDAETERSIIMRDMLNKEIARVDPSDRRKVRGLAGPDKMSKIAQLILERAAEPSHRLSPDDLKMVQKAVSAISSRSERDGKRLRLGGTALLAGILYYVYNIFDWSP